MELNKKNTWYIPFLYGFVVFIANFIGSQIPVSSSINLETQNFTNYQNIISQHQTIVNVLTSFCYFIHKLYYQTICLNTLFPGGHTSERDGIVQRLFFRCSGAPG